MDRARIKALGNAIVPQVAFELLRTMATYNAAMSGEPKASPLDGTVMQED